MSGLRGRWPVGPAGDVSSPLVGRDHDLEAIDSAYASSVSVVLLGEAGVGKSWLVDEALIRLARRGCATSAITAGPSCC